MTAECVANNENHFSRQMSRRVWNNKTVQTDEDEFDDDSAFDQKLICLSDLMKKRQEIVGHQSAKKFDKKAWSKAKVSIRRSSFVGALNRMFSARKKRSATVNVVSKCDLFQRMVDNDERLMELIDDMRRVICRFENVMDAVEATLPHKGKAAMLPNKESIEDRKPKRDDEIKSCDCLNITVAQLESPNRSRFEKVGDAGKRWKEEFADETRSIWPDRSINLETPKSEVLLCCNRYAGPNSVICYCRRSCCTCFNDPWSPFWPQPQEQRFQPISENFYEENAESSKIQQEKTTEEASEQMISFEVKRPAYDESISLRSLSISSFADDGNSSPVFMTTPQWVGSVSICPTLRLSSDKEDDGDDFELSHLFEESDRSPGAMSDEERAFFEEVKGQQMFIDDLRNEKEGDSEKSNETYDGEHAALQVHEVEAQEDSLLFRMKNYFWFTFWFKN